MAEPAPPQAVMAGKAGYHRIDADDEPAGHNPHDGLVVDSWGASAGTEATAVVVNLLQSMQNTIETAVGWERQDCAAVVERSQLAAAMRMEEARQLVERFMADRVGWNAKRSKPQFTMQKRLSAEQPRSLRNLN